MSYPEPRFLGGAGEISATARPAVAAPEVILPTTNVHYLATGATTGGDFGLYRREMAGPPSGPAPHFHARSPSRSRCCPARLGSTTAATGPTPAPATTFSSRPAASTPSATSPGSRPRC